MYKFSLQFYAGGENAFSRKNKKNKRNRLFKFKTEGDENTINLEPNWRATRHKIKRFTQRSGSGGSKNNQSLRGSYMEKNYRIRKQSTSTKVSETKIGSIASNQHGLGNLKLGAIKTKRFQLNTKIPAGESSLKSLNARKMSQKPRRQFNIAWNTSILRNKKFSIKTPSAAKNGFFTPRLNKNPVFVLKRKRSRPGRLLKFD